MSGQAGDSRHVSAGVEQIRDEGAAHIVRAEGLDARLNPPLLEHVVNRLVGQPPIDNFAAFVDRAEERGIVGCARAQLQPSGYTTGAGSLSLIENAPSW